MRWENVKLPTVFCETKYICEKTYNSIKQVRKQVSKVIKLSTYLNLKMALIIL